MSVVDDVARDEAADDESAELPPAQQRTQGRWGSMGVPLEKSKDFGGSVRRLGQLLKPEWPMVSVVVVIAIVSAILNVLGPRVLGHGTDIIIRGLSRGINVPELHHVLYQAAFVYGSSMVLGVLSAYILAGVVQRLMYRLREAVERKLNHLPLKYVDQQERGDLLSRVTNDIDNIAQSLQQTMSQMLTSTLLLVGVVVMMFTISWQLALVALTTVPVSIYAMRAIAARARPRFIAQWRHTGSLNAQIEETFTGHSIVKAFGRQKEVEGRFRDTNDELY